MTAGVFIQLPAPAVDPDAAIVLALERLAIDADGLDEFDRRNPRMLTGRHGSLEALAAAIGEPAHATLPVTVHRRSPPSPAMTVSRPIIFHDC